MASVGYATLQIIPSMRGVQGNLLRQLGGPATAAGTAAGKQMSGAMTGAVAAGGVRTGNALLDPIRRSTESARSELATMGGTFRRIATVAGGAIAAIGIYRMGRDIAGVASEATKTEASLDAMYQASEHGAGEAARATELLFDTFGRSSIPMSAFQDGAESLAYLGLNAEESVGIMGFLEDTILATGGSSEEMSRVTAALTTSLNRGKVSMNEMNRISEAGVPIFDMLTAQFGVTEEELESMVTSGEVGVDDLTQALQEVPGTFGPAMQEASDNVRDTLPVAWESARNGITNAIARSIIPMVERLAPVVQRMGNTAVDAIEAIPRILGDIGDFLRRTGIADWFANLWNTIRPILPVVGQFAAVFGGLVVGLWAGTHALNGITTGFRVLGLIMKAHPVLLAVAAIAAGLMYAWNNSETFRRIVTQAFERVQEAIGWVVDRIQVLWQSFEGGGGLERVQTLFTNVWGTIQDVVGNAVAFIRDAVARVMGSEIVTEVQTTLGVWRDWLSTFFSWMGDAFQFSFGLVLDVVQGVWARLQPIVSAGVSFFRAIIGPFLDWIGTAFRVAWELVQTIVAAALRAVRGDISGATERIRKGWERVWGLISDFVGRQWAVIRDLVGTAIEYLRGWISSRLQLIQAIWSRIWAAVRVFVQQVWQRIRDHIRDTFDRIRARIQSTLEGIQTRWNAIWTAIRVFVQQVWQRIRDRIRETFDRIRTFISDTLNRIWNFWRDRWTAVRTFVTDTWNRIRDMIRDRFNAIRTRIGDVLRSIRDTWRDIWTNIRTRTTDIWNAIRDGIRDRIHAVRDRIRDTMIAIRDAWRDRWRNMREIALDLVRRIRTGVQNVITGLRDSLGNIMAGIRNRFVSPLNWVIRRINNFTDRVTSMINKIPGVSVEIGNIKELPTANKGGIVPGSGPDRDSVLMGLTPGEMVVNRRSTEANRVLLDQMNRRPGRALGNIEGERESGGIQTAADRRRPPFGHPDYPGPEAGYRVGRGAPIPSRLRGSETISALRAYARTSGIAHRLTSGYRIGSTTYHGRARAADFAPPSSTRAGYRNSTLRGLFHHFSNVGSQLRELILSGAPFRITGGRRRGGDGGGRLRATHWDHVHAATNSRDLGAGRELQGGGDEGGGFFDLFAPVRRWIENNIDKWFDSNDELSGPFGDGIKGLAKHVLKQGMDALNPFSGDEITSGGSGPAAAQGWVRAAMQAAGVSGDTWFNGLMTIARRESNFNPRAQNNWDSNARRGTPSRGLMQTIDPTFNAHKVRGMGNIWNPVHNAAAAIRYIISRYGHISRVQQADPNRPPKGYAKGGFFTKPNVIGIGEAGPEYALPEARLERVAQEAADAAVGRRTVVELSADDRELLRKAANAQDVDVHVQAWSERFSWRQVRDELARHEVV